jgi:hypothetical protein
LRSRNQEKLDNPSFSDSSGLVGALACANAIAGRPKPFRPAHPCPHSELFCNVEVNKGGLRDLGIIF